MLLHKQQGDPRKELRKRSNDDQSKSIDLGIHSLDFFPGVAADGRSGFRSQQLWLDLIDDGGLIPDAFGCELVRFSLVSLISLLFFHKSHENFANVHAHDLLQFVSLFFFLTDH